MISCLLLVSFLGVSTKYPLLCFVYLTKIYSCIYFIIDKYPSWVNTYIA